MMNTLLDAARRYAEVYSDDNGIAQTRIPGLMIVRETSPTALQYAISKPLVAMVLQGSKRVTMGSQNIELGAGESLLITADIPTVSQITKANASVPYISVIIDLDPAIIEGLVTDLDSVSASSKVVPLRVDTTDSEVADTALRLLRLLDRPSMLSILQAQLLRELHLWMLTGRHGSAIRGLGISESHAQRIGRAVAIIRAEFARPLRVEELASAASMSSSSFHEHFRAITSLTPLQFQKQLRLIEAKRLMLSEGEMISNAAYAVGYESVPQFTREYGRMFGLPPARDMKATMNKLRSAAA